MVWSRLRSGESTRIQPASIVFSDARSGCKPRHSASDTVLFPAPGAPLMSQIAGRAMTGRRITTRSGRATKTAARLWGRSPNRRAWHAPFLRVGLNTPDVEAVRHDKFVCDAVMAIDHPERLDPAGGAIARTPNAHQHRRIVGAGSSVRRRQDRSIHLFGGHFRWREAGGGTVAIRKAGPVGL